MFAEGFTSLKFPRPQATCQHQIDPRSFHPLPLTPRLHVQLFQPEFWQVAFRLSALADHEMQFQIMGVTKLLPQPIHSGCEFKWTPKQNENNGKPSGRQCDTLRPGCLNLL